MDEARQAIREALALTRPAPEKPVVIAAAEPAEDSDETIGELQVSEYIIYLFALDTYIRYVEETTKQDDPTDDVIVKGIRLLRIADTDLDGIKGFLDGHLPSENHKKMLGKYLRMRATDSGGVGRRALGLRTLLSRGGSATMRAIFETNRALKQVREAIAASMMDDADAALDLFAKMLIRNGRLRNWIDLAAQTAGSGILPTNVVEAGATEAQDQKQDLLTQNIQQLASSGADESNQAHEAQSARLVQVQEEATASARKALEQSGEPDEPLTKSEVVGVAVAAAAAAMSDPSNPQNIPDALRSLDNEQQAAALTDGKVLVAAGAGAGKSTTLVARVKYLLQDRRQDPSRVLVTSFNKKAANELGAKIENATGLSQSQSGMTVGTMHSLFRAFISDFGSPDEKAAMRHQEPSGFVGGGDKVARAAQKIWEECFDSKERPTPKLKAMKLAKTQWAGNDVSPAEAKTLAVNAEERDAADWYELYEGLKGSIPGWAPPCEDKAKDAADRDYEERLRQWQAKGSNPKYRPQKPGTTFEVFMARVRKGGMKLGDFDDMIKWFRDILVRNPGARKRLQAQFDHFLVDECQDLNKAQHEAFKYMTEHIDAEKGTSLWMVGDDKQSIYSFRGARPDLFTDLDGKEGWTTRMIRTNYRCEPEIVDAANRLIAFNDRQIPMQANANPRKVRGVGSIRLETPGDDAEAAIDTVDRIKSGGTGMDNGGKAKFYGTNSILCRTNAELHSFETACIIRGVPYARKGSGSFLGSPETEAMLGYVELVMGTDAEAMQKALGDILSRPNRFWMGPKDCAEVVQNALREYARNLRVPIKSIHPVMALRESAFQELLGEAIARKRGKGSAFGFAKDISRLSGDLDELQAMTSEKGFTTENLFNAILGLKGKAQKVNATTGRSEMVEETFREALTAFLRDKDDEDDDTEEEEVDDEALLGNITFLYRLAEVDPTDSSDLENPPTTPDGFQAKIERYRKLADDLRIDLNEWEKKNPGKPPPAVYLGTVHGVKGAEWANCFVQMPKGKFPIERKKKRDEDAPPPTPAEIEKEKEELESERRLGYVALTRAAKNLTVICPMVVGGRKAGISRFVAEAALTPGENVPKPEDGGDVPPLPKEAAADLDLSAEPYETEYSHA